MGLFHQGASLKDKSWTVKDTASYFEVSIGLASENLRLAQAIQKHEKMMLAANREDALRMMRGFV